MAIVSLIFHFVVAMVAIYLAVITPFAIIAAPFVLLWCIRRMLTSRDPEVIRRAKIIERIERSLP